MGGERSSPMGQPGTVGEARTTLLRVTHTQLCCTASDGEGVDCTEGVLNLMRELAYTLTLALVACGPTATAEDYSEDGSVGASTDELGYPTTRADGSALTAEFCSTEEALAIYGNTKTCSMIACDQGDEDSCGIAQTFATQQAPEEAVEEADDLAYTMPHNESPTEDAYPRD